jgi:hypothetical protein
MSFVDHVEHDAATLGGASEPGGAFLLIGWPDVRGDRVHSRRLPGRLAGRDRHRQDRRPVSARGRARTIGRYAYSRTNVALARSALVLTGWV